jgi:hypothetical protein
MNDSPRIIDLQQQRLLKREQEQEAGTGAGVA